MARTLKPQTHWKALTCIRASEVRRILRQASKRMFYSVRSNQQDLVWLYVAKMQHLAIGSRTWPYLECFWANDYFFDLIFPVAHRSFSSKFWGMTGETDRVRLVHKNSYNRPYLPGARRNDLGRGCRRVAVLELRLLG